MITSSLKTNNSLEKFKKLIPGKKNVPRDIDSKLSPKGDFEELEGIDVIIKGITTILLTSKGTYVFDPEFGLGLHRYIFEPADEVTKNSIENEVRDALKRYEGRVQTNFRVVFLNNKKGFRLDLSIKYQGSYKKVHITFDESLLRTLPAS